MVGAYSVLAVFGLGMAVLADSSVGRIAGIAVTLIAIAQVVHLVQREKRQ